MLSIIIQEHSEGRPFIIRMLEQIEALDLDKEVQMVTSLPYDRFLSSYNINLRDRGFPIYLTGNVHSCGSARNVGSKLSTGDTLLYLDCHTCFNNDGIAVLLQTLDRNKDSIVAPAIEVVDFPSCKPEGGIGYGVAFRFINNDSFQWTWLSPDHLDRPYPVPFVCGCAFSMKRSTYNVLARYGGFLDVHTGLSWEEEKSMRLARLGHPTLIEPRAIVGHYFKGYSKHKQWDSHSVKDNLLSKAAGFYINVFNPELYTYIDSMLKRTTGAAYERDMKRAAEAYSWLRRKLEPFANRIDENWYLRRV